MFHPMVYSPNGNSCQNQDSGTLRFRQNNLFPGQRAPALRIPEALVRRKAGSPGRRAEPARRGARVVQSAARGRQAVAD